MSSLSTVIPQDSSPTKTSARTHPKDILSEASLRLRDLARNPTAKAAASLAMWNPSAYIIKPKAAVAIAEDPDVKERFSFIWWWSGNTRNLIFEKK